MKILVNCQSGIGINILSVPMLRAIKSNYPESYVHLIVQFKGGMDLLEGCPYFDEISVLNYDMVRNLGALLRFFKKLRKIRYDYSFNLFPSNRLDKNVFQLLVNATVRVSHQYSYRKNFHLNFINDTGIDIDYKAHDVEQNLNLLKVIGIDPNREPRHLELFIPDEIQSRADSIASEFGRGTTMIGIHPGSSKNLTMDLKRWPARYFAELADKLKSRYDCEILLFGSRDEDPIKQEIKNTMESDCHIVTELDIQTTAALIKMCKLFISNDSGLMHIAAATGVRTIGIFGPTDPVRTAPYGEDHVVVRSGITCSPCFSIHTVGKKISCIYKERKCLIVLLPEQVMSEIMMMENQVLKNEVKVDANK